MRNKNLTCNACRRRANSTVSGIIIDPITNVPILHEVPQAKKVQKKIQKKVQKKVQKKTQSQSQPSKVQPNAQPVFQEAIKPHTNLRNGYYSQPIFKTYLRGTPLVQNLAAYNPPNRYCYSIISSIKSIVGI